MKVLWSSAYSEPLKHTVDYARALKSCGHEVVVVNSVVEKVSVEEDIIRVKKITNNEFGTVLTFSEKIPQNGAHNIDFWVGLESKFNSFQKKTLKKYWRNGLEMILFSNLRREMHYKREAQKLYAKIKPDLVVVTGDQSPLQKYFVRFAKKNELPSINIQWTVSDSAYNSALDLLNRKRSSHGYLRHYFRKAQLMCLNLLGFESYFRIATFGGGKSTIFSVIGPRAVAEYKKLGVDGKKMVVVGHPLFEKCYLKKLRKFGEERRSVFDKLGLDVNAPMLLWATNEQRTYYLGTYKESEIIDAIHSKLVAILSSNPEVQILIKLHPAENFELYKIASEGLERVFIDRDFEVADLVAHSDIVLIRFSSSVVYAICSGVPALSYNYPRFPGADLYKELGGTIHFEKDYELTDLVADLLSPEFNETKKMSQDRERMFIDEFFQFSTKTSEQKFVELTEGLMNK